MGEEKIMAQIGAEEFAPGALVARAWCPGRSRTKGSLKPMHVRGQGGRACKLGLTEDHVLSNPWKKRQMIALVKGERRVAGPYGWPVEVRAFYRFDRADVVPGDVYAAETWPMPTAQPVGDVDKLWRSTLDALTQAKIITDDALVVGGAPFKRWVRAGERAGVLIVVTAARPVEDIIRMEIEAAALR